MIHSIEGKITAYGENFVVLEAGGLGFKVFMHERALRGLGGIGETAKAFCRLQPREDAIELYGFSNEGELRFFELLISVSGVGPRLALAILQVANLQQLAAAIREGRPDVLTRASGIGRRTAERIIVELRNKVEVSRSGETVKAMEADADILEVLVALGYRRDEARAALSKIEEKTSGFEDRLKATLKVLGRKQ